MRWPFSPVPCWRVAGHRQQGLCRDIPQFPPSSGARCSFPNESLCYERSCALNVNKYKNSQVMPEPGQTPGSPHTSGCYSRCKEAPANVKSGIALAVPRGAYLAHRGLGKSFQRKTEDICSKNPYITVRFDEILAPFNFKKRETCFNFLLGKYATILSQQRIDVSFSLKSLRVFNQR